MFRFNVDTATWLSEETKDKIRKHLGREMTKDGLLVVKSDRTESKTLNMADALEKLRTNIRMAENPVDDTCLIREQEQRRKNRLNLARKRLHISLE